MFRFKSALAENLKVLLTAYYTLNFWWLCSKSVQRFWHRTTEYH